MSRRNLILILTLITAIIHIYVGAVVPATILLLNGIGFLALAAARYFIPQLAPYKNIIHWAFIAYTAITIVGYFARWGVDGLTDPTGMAAKIVEVALIIILFLDRD